MVVYLKKSRIISLCILPVIVVIINLFSLYFEYTGDFTQTIYSTINNPRQMIELFIGLLICILFSFYYVYLGFLFDRNSNSKVYKTFKSINILWGFLSMILEVLGIFIPTGMNLDLISPIMGIIISIFIILLQLIDVYLILTYNDALKKITVS